MWGRSQETEHLSHIDQEAHQCHHDRVCVTYKAKISSSVCGLCGTGDRQAAVASWGRRPRGQGRQEAHGHSSGCLKVRVPDGPRSPRGQPPGAMGSSCKRILPAHLQSILTQLD